MIKFFKMNNQAAFLKLKPLCVAFLRDCNVQNIQNLENVVKNLDSESVQSLQEFILLPVRACLNAEIREKVTISCINFLSCVFKKSSITDWSIFSDFFKLMIYKLCDTQEINKVLEGREELKSAVCENISCLVQSSTEEILNEMYSLSFRHNLAHAFYMLNIMLNYEKSKTLQLTVLSTIGTLAYSETLVEKRYNLTEEIASEALASCLPGLSIALQKVACADVKQGYNAIVKSLNILADLIVLVLGDDSYRKCYAKNSTSIVYQHAYKSGKLSKIPDSASGDIPVILKDESWFELVSEKLKILLQNLITITNHSHWKVRLQFIKFASRLLLKCTKTLENCVPVLLPTVFELSVDKNYSISVYCNEFLVKFSEHFQSINASSLNLIIEENIDNLTSEVIRCKVSGSDDKKLTYVQCLQGYIEVLGSSINTWLFSMIRVEKIILSLMNLFEFDSSIVNVIEEIPIIDSFSVLNDKFDPLWPKKRFKYFENEDILKSGIKICYRLGRIHNCQLIIDLLVEKLSSSDSFSLQSIFFIGYIIKGLSFESISTEKRSFIVGEVIEVLMSNSLFDVPIHDNDDFAKQNIPTSSELIASTSTFNKNKLQICLLLEAVANCASCLQNDFKIHLIKVLCPVMEKAGCSNFVISQCGRLSLFIIAQSCGYNSINELIKDNADYITNILLINFNSYLYKPEISVVLRVAVQQCDSEALILFRDLIFQILNYIDLNQEKAYFLMHILFSVTDSIKRWFPSKQISLEKSTIKSVSEQSLKSAILNYVALKKTVEEINDDITEIETEPSSSNDIDDSYLEEELKTEIPLHVNITCEIFKRCIHLQASENKFFRMLVLEIVELCIVILRNYENQLHPLIHEFWNPFLKRFLEETFVSKAFDVLLTIVNQCGDFVHHRTFKDVMPKLILFLKKECFKSHKSSFKNYQWTKEHSLQILILSKIGYICSKLDVDSKDICEVANVCLPYLEKIQPKILQDAAIESLKELSILDSDAIWFYYNVKYSKEKLLVPLNEYLGHITFPYSNSALSETNIDFL